MKKKFTKAINKISARFAYFVIGVICAVAILTSVYAVYAAIGHVSGGQTLTAAKWNELVDAVNDLQNNKGELVCVYKKASSKTGAQICNSAGEYCMHAYLPGYGLNNCHQNLISPWKYLCCKVD